MYMYMYMYMCMCICACVCHTVDGVLYATIKFIKLKGVYMMDMSCVLYMYTCTTLHVCIYIM